MSCMKELLLDMEELYIQGYNQYSIASMLNVPLSMVTGYFNDEVTSLDALQFDNGKELAKEAME